MHHPLVRWSLIIFVLLILTTPILAADIASAAIEGIQTALANLGTFGSSVVPK